ITFWPLATALSSAIPTSLGATLPLRSLSQVSDCQPQARAESNPTTALNPSATIDSGVVIGTTTTLPSATVAVNKFLGIPFAVTPPERFSPPQPAGKFRGPLYAQAVGPACTQQFIYPEEVRNFTLAVFNTPAPVESEDCLYLNVFAPATSSKDKAVMFWTYGGGLQNGNGGQPVYDGSSFAANQDVIIVNYNYRTNVFGFSNSPELPLTSRNAGFFDQRLALDWVHRNIAAFGGDPEKVTVFGESAGASSTDRLVTAPPPGPPFRAAIIQSGQASVSAFPRGTSGPDAWITLVEALNCTSASSQLACVRAADALTIKSIIEHAGLYFSPVTDNITQIATPVNRSEHHIANVSYMIGTNGQEGRSYAADITNLTGFIDSEFPDAALQKAVTAAYPVGQDGLITQGDVAAQIYTEWVFQCPAALVAHDSAASGYPTWRYYFNASFPNTQPGFNVTIAGLPDLNFGAWHSSELSIVFGTYPTLNATVQEVTLSRFVQTAWANFAKDPTTKGPGWPRIGSTEQDLGDLGANGSEGLTMITEEEVDFRCGIYAPIYANITAPAF
ncbi:MAG: hypothetical protein Q9181_007638, partial [Wetmoreana brouardii]